MIYDNRLYQLEERLGQDFYKSGDRRISLIVVEDAGHLFETKEKAEEALSDYLAELEKIQEARKVSIGPAGLTSAIGHQDTANVLGVPMNRVNVHLSKGDVAYVAQLMGGRLPEGSTTLPDGFTFKFIKVTIG